MFGKKRAKEQRAIRRAYVGSSLMTMAQAVAALEDAWQRDGGVTRHLGHMVLAVAANVEDELGGREYVGYTHDLLASAMGLDTTTQTWTMFAQLPAPLELQSSLMAELLVQETVDKGESFKVFESALAPTYGYDPTTEALPVLIVLNCHHAALTMVTSNEDTRFDPPELQFERRMITAGLEARMLVMWRMMEKFALEYGRDLGYQPRST